MTSDKVDSRLRAEMQRLERRGDSDTTLPVIIEHEAPAGGEGEPRDISAFEARVHAAQSGLRRRLTAIGARDVQPMVLANALAAQLTPVQIRDIADDPDVKRILWNLSERVTT